MLSLLLSLSVAFAGDALFSTPDGAAVSGDTLIVTPIGGAAIDDLACDADGVVDEGLDSDSDGVCDAGDADAAVDETDSDGVCDVGDWDDCDAAIDEGLDNDGDGLCDADRAVDETDSDGVCDDLDADGIVDEDTTDTDGDGLCDAGDADDCDAAIDEGIDTDGDGLCDAIDARVDSGGGFVFGCTTYAKAPGGKKGFFEGDDHLISVFGVDGKYAISAQTDAKACAVEIWGAEGLAWAGEADCAALGAVDSLPASADAALVWSDEARGTVPEVTLRW